jgi:hypothetical protein
VQKIFQNHAVLRARVRAPLPASSSIAAKGAKASGEAKNVKKGNAAKANSQQFQKVEVLLGTHSGPKASNFRLWEASKNPLLSFAIITNAYDERTMSGLPGWMEATVQTLCLQKSGPSILRKAALIRGTLTAKGLPTPREVAKELCAEGGEEKGQGKAEIKSEESRSELGEARLLAKKGGPSCSDGLHFSRLIDRTIVCLRVQRKVAHAPRGRP